MGTNNRLLKTFRGRIALLLILRLLIRFSTVFAFILGMVILIARVGFAVRRSFLLWLFLGYLPFLISAVVLSVKRIPSYSSLKALLDSRNKCGGLLMAGDEVDLGFWQGSLGPLNAPVLRWRAGKAAAVFTLAVIFVIVSFVVPQRYMKIASARPLNIGMDVKELGEQIETLKQEEIITAEKADEYEQKLEQLKDKASGYDPVKTWEALDHIQQNVRQEAEKAAMDALSQTESLTRAAGLAEGLYEGGSEIKSDVYSESVSELSAMVKGLLSENELLRNSLNPDLLSACEKCELSSEQLKQLADALKAHKLKLSADLAKLCEAGLADLKNLKMCEMLGQCDIEGLKAFLCQDANSMCIGDALSMCCGCPGRGGVSRGRADAAMTWTEGSSEEGAKFKEQVLPAGSLAALKESMTIGVTVEAPTVEEGLAPVSGDVLGQAEAGGGEAFRRTILPRHKGAVKRYFERK